MLIIGPTTGFAAGHQTHTPAVVPSDLSAPPRCIDWANRGDRSESRVALSRSLGITLEERDGRKCATTDLPLSVLYKWSQSVGAAGGRTRRGTGDSLSTPLFNRASLVRS